MFLKLFLLFGMMFLHIVDDYYLQGWLASAKQKSWWEKNAPNKLYKYDYIMALFEHAFSWTFMIMLIPTIYVLLYNKTFSIILYCFVFIFNWIVHAYIDNKKANELKINLIIDQLLHILQIIVTFIIFIL